MDPLKLVFGLWILDDLCGGRIRGCWRGLTADQAMFPGTGFASKFKARSISPSLFKSAQIRMGAITEIGRERSRERIVNAPPIALFLRGLRNSHREFWIINSLPANSGGDFLRPVGLHTSWFVCLVRFCSCRPLWECRLCRQPARIRTRLLRYRHRKEHTSIWRTKRVQLTQLAPTPRMSACHRPERH
jgi:hypothetical protein